MSLCLLSTLPDSLESLAGRCFSLSLLRSFSFLSLFSLSLWSLSLSSFSLSSLFLFSFSLESLTTSFSFSLSLWSLSSLFSLSLNFFSLSLSLFLFGGAKTPLDAQLPCLLFEELPPQGTPKEVVKSPWEPGNLLGPVLVLVSTAVVCLVDPRHYSKILWRGSFRWKILPVWFVQLPWLHSPPHCQAKGEPNTRYHENTMRFWCKKNMMNKMMISDSQRPKGNL